jgi:hypothetical protein
MDKVPDAGAFADLCAFVDDGAGVDGGGHGGDGYRIESGMTFGGWIPGQARYDRFSGGGWRRRGGLRPARL